MKILPLNPNMTCFRAKKQKFDCNQKDNDGVHIFEKVIKTEEKELLPYFYLTEEEIVFTPGMLDAYKNIKNLDYKQEIEKSERIFMRFPELEKAIEENDLNGIRSGLKTLSECKFCNRFHTLYLLASSVLRDKDSIKDKYSRSREFVKSSEEFMPEVFDNFYYYFTDTLDYILNIKKYIKHPEFLEKLLKP